MIDRWDEPKRTGTPDGMPGKVPGDNGSRLPRGLTWLLPDRWSVGALVLFWLLVPLIYDGDMWAPFELLLRPLVMPYYLGLMSWDLLERWKPEAISSAAFWWVGRWILPYILASLVAIPLRLLHSGGRGASRPRPE